MRARNIAALVANPDVVDASRLAPFHHFVQRHHAVLDGDEVAVAEVASRAVARLARVIHRIQLDEAFATLAKEPHRKQAHLALKLAFDLVDHGALRVTRSVDHLRTALPVGTGRATLRLPELEDAAGQVVAKRGNAGVAVRQLLRDGVMCEPATEAERERGQRKG